MTAPSAEFVVSVAPVGSDGDLDAVHAAAGVLADIDLVVLPEPPASLLQPGAELQALIAPLPLSPDRAVERIAASRAAVLLVPGPPKRPVIAYLELASACVCAAGAYPDGYPAPLDPARQSVLRTCADGDLWSAFERAGVVGSDYRAMASGGDVVGQLLRRAPSAAAGQTAGETVPTSVREHPYNAVTDVHEDFCFPPFKACSRPDLF